MAYGKEKKTLNYLKKWKESNYNLDKNKKFSHRSQNHILYYFLKQNNINKINLNKINGLKTYILSSKVKLGFRLSHTTFFIKKGQQLILKRG